MSPQEFEQFVRQVIAEEVTAGQPCSCCGAVEVDHGDAAQRIAEKFATEQAA